MVLTPRTSSLPKLRLKPGRWTVGSASTCSYRIAGDGVRPRHALVLCGGQATVLKAWDSHTWHNGQPVLGEVRLQPGDQVKLGSVEFSIEHEGTIDETASRPVASPETVARSPAIGSPTTEPDGWDLERLRGQIQELRDELSQRVLRRSGAVATATTPIITNEPETEPASARLAELERSAAEARSVVEQTRQELTAARAEHARREAELLKLADDLRPTLDATQQEVAELHRELDRMRSAAAQREQAWEQQTGEWTTEREQWQEELVSLANARQQSAADWEQRQSVVLDEVSHWKTECEQLRTGWQLQQSAWDDERSRLQDESRRHEETIQQMLQTATQREQELVEHSQQLLSERQQIEAERQQFQAEKNEREQAVAALTEERQHVEQHAAEVLAKFEDFSKRMTEFEQQQANFVREQQTLEHSWNWLQSDRRKLVEEKEEWQQQRAHWQAERERWSDENEQLQRDRDEFAKARDLWHEQHTVAQQVSVEADQLAVERQQLEAEKSAWATQREQFEAELQMQQQAICAEQGRLQVLRAEFEARAADRPAFDVSPTSDDEPSSWNHTSEEFADNGRESELTAAPQTWSPDSMSAEIPLTSSATLTDAWSVGVDLTAPRETHTVGRGAESEFAPEPTPLSQPTSGGDAASSAPLWDTETTPLWDTVTTSPPFPEDVRTETSDESESSSGAWESVATTPSESDANSDQLTDPNVTIPRDPLAVIEAAVQPPPFAEAEATLDREASDARDEEPVDPPKAGPVVSILESMAFAEDEHIDDSVSRYMQHLLARSQQPDGGNRDRYIPVPTGKKASAVVSTPAKPSNAVCDADGHAPVPPAVGSGIQAGISQPEHDGPSMTDPTPSRLQPVHHQDKSAIRAATEQMRQVANQQTVKNVEAANWKQIKLSLKTKLALAALSFVLSAGLLYWGYHYRPEFLILGFCASGLGVLTWLDLLVAIRQARSRTSQLAGRKKTTGKAKS